MVIGTCPYLEIFEYEWAPYFLIWSATTKETDSVVHLASLILAGCQTSSLVHPMWTTTGFGPYHETFEYECAPCFLTWTGPIKNSVKQCCQMWLRNWIHRPSFVPIEATVNKTCTRYMTSNKKHWSKGISDDS
jgi:hypothetical protein